VLGRLKAHLDWYLSPQREFTNCLAVCFEIRVNQILLSGHET
jgi:hypothetical protein